LQQGESVDNIARRRARAENLLISQRNYRRARDRALTRLAGRHRKEYLALLEEEKANDRAQGKTWVDIAGNTEHSLGSLSNGAQQDRTITGEDEGD